MQQPGSWMGRPVASRAIAAMAMAFLALGASVAAAPTGAGKLPVRGRVTDEKGQGVPGQTVRLLKSRTFVKLGGMRSLDQSVEEKRAVTDSLGFFEFEFDVDASFPYYYLRFYDPKTFDAVQYRLPEDREITKRVRTGRPVEVSIGLKVQKDWPQVKALIDAYTPGSQVGQILRSLGLPRSRAPEGPGRELWRYDQAGKAYVVEGERVIETRTIPGGARQADDGPGTKDEPSPAVRVEEP